MSLEHLSVEEQGEQQCQLFQLSIEAVSGYVQIATSSGLQSTRTAKGRTAGVKRVVILPQNVFPSLLLPVVQGVPESYAACL